MTQRIPYVRFIWVGFIFSLLISVLIVGPEILFKGADASAGLRDYAVSFAALSLVWLLNLIGLRLSESYAQHKYTFTIRIILSFILVIAAILLFHYLFDFNRPPPPRAGIGNQMPIHREWVKLFSGFITGFSLNLLVLMSLELLLLRNSKSDMEADNLKLREEKLQAVNLMLKQQIQPHFLFNSLNTLKSLIHRNTDKAEDYLLKLSEFLRGSISTGDKASVPISEELMLCSNYLDLQTVRFGAALQHEFIIPQATMDNGFVPPFSIQLLIENAIKHNALTKESPLTIVVTEDNGWVCVSNNLQPRSTPEESTGIGLANLSARYESLANEVVLIDRTETTFEVKIKII